MSKRIDQIPGLPEILAKMSRRIDALETGGKELSGITDEDTASVTLAAGAESTGLTSVLQWADSNVQVNPKGFPSISLYIDTDNDADYFFPHGSSLTSAMRDFDFKYFLDKADLDTNQYQNKARFYLKNNDASQHTYYLKIKWIYLLGGSSGSVV